MNVSTKPFLEKDLRLIGVLLASGEVKFVGTEISPEGIVYCKFEPAELAEAICTNYYAYSLKGIQPKQLLESYETARSIVFRAKDEAQRKGGHGEPR